MVKEYHYHLFIYKAFYKIYFNYIKAAKKYYSKNVYYKYEKKKNLNTKSAKEMVSFYDQVRTIFIKPSFPVYEADEQPETTDMPE